MQRNSRWTSSPVKSKGEIVGTRFMPTDMELLKCLGKHPYLTSPDLAAATGRSEKAVAGRVNRLKRKPMSLIQVAPAQLEEKRLYQWTRQALCLTHAGASKLREIGFEPKPRSSRNLIHQLTLYQETVSIEIGARAKGLEHVLLEEKPITVTFTHKGHTYHDYALHPDAGPIGLGYPDGTYCFLVLETDCASEDLTSSDPLKQAIEKKFAAYSAALEQGLYDQWKIPGLTVAFTTTTKRRMDGMVRLLASMNLGHEESFIFTDFPTILSETPQPTDKSWAVTRSWTTGLNRSLNLGE